MKKWLLLPFAALIFCVCAIWFIVATQTGLQLVHKTLEKLVGEYVSIEEVDGRLSSSFSLSNIKIDLPTLTISVSSFSYEWEPLSLVAAKLDIQNLVVGDVILDFKDSGAEQTEQDDEGGDFSLPPLVLPVRLDLGNLEVSSVLFIDAGEEVFKIDRMGGRFSTGISNVSVENFYLFSNDVDLKVHGAISFLRDWKLDLIGSYRFVGYGFHELQGTFSLSDTLESPRLDFGVNSPADIRITGQVRDLFDAFEYTALLEAADVDLSRLIEYCPEIILHKVRGDLHGNLDGYGGVVSADGTWGVMDGLHLKTQISADWWGIDFDTLQITRDDGIAIADNAKISWKELFDWEGDFDFRSFDPEPLTDALKGRLSAKFHSVGKVLDEGLSATFDIDKLSGIINERPVYGSGVMYLSESGISSDSFTLNSGELAGTAYLENGSFSWDNDMPWAVEVELENFDPSGINLGLYGSVSGNIAAEGSWPDDSMRGRISMTDLRGTIRELPLAGSGEISFLGEQITSPGLRLQLGSALLDVEGQAGEDLAVEFTLSIPELDALLDDTSGLLHASGSIAGNLKTPALNIEFFGEHLQMQDEKIGSIDGNISYAKAEEDSIDVSLEASGLELGGMLLNSADLGLTGSVTNHAVDFSGRGGLGVVRMQAVGGYFEGWSGRINKFDLDMPYGSWSQKSPSGVTINSSSADVDNFCLSNVDSDICLGGKINFADQGWQVAVDIDQLALSWLNVLKVVPYPVNGSLSGKLHAVGIGSELDLVNGSFSLPEADVQLDIEDEALSNLGFDDVQIDFDVDNGLLLAEVSTRIRGDGRVGVIARIDGFQRVNGNFLPLPVNGSIELDKFDISLLSAFSGNYLQPTGRVTSDILVSGTIGNPEFQGRLNIEGGGIFLPYQGITLEELDLDVQAAENGAHVTCSAMSGPGKITARGVVNWSGRDVDGSFAVTGDDFLLVSLPEYSLRVNPAVHFAFSGHKGSVSGEVLVPYARITPEEMTESVSVSEDIIFVNGAEEEETGSWPVGLDLNVRLGDDVRVEGYGLTGQVVGNLNVRTSEDKVLTGNGEITLQDASFTIYSRSLDIVRGRLLFSGGAIDNPGVDVRAQKKVSEEEAKGVGYTVGIDISGLVQDLQYHLFSDPYMEETEILSRLLIGRSLSSATPEEGGLLEAALVTLGVQGSGSFVKGIGDLLSVDELHLEGSSSKEDVSLVVGKRLTDDLYIGYDVNMFSRLGQFRVRYDLNHGFAVETKSSSESTGADLLYSFER